MRLTGNNTPKVRDWVADVSFGNESPLGACEEADVRHLFKMRRSTRAFLSRLASASQLSAEERRPRLIAHAFRAYGTVRRLFPPDIGGQTALAFARSGNPTACGHFGASVLTGGSKAS
ncbi:MAG TPA: hypothetical protein DD637_04760 [Verrucomicrobia bacterium]|nr:hypothetical protein [Verrucomicrobiota bacterium]HCG20403.1 hypothetical protein [Verrucomicrobiota bacterium]